MERPIKRRKRSSTESSGRNHKSTKSNRNDTTMTNQTDCSTNKRKFQSIESSEYPEQTESTLPEELDDSSVSTTESTRITIRSIVQSLITQVCDLVDKEEIDDGEIVDINEIQAYSELDLPQEIVKEIEALDRNEQLTQTQKNLFAFLRANHQNDVFIQIRPYSNEIVSFLASSLSRIDESNKVPQLIVVTVTGELVAQISRTARNIVRRTAISVTNLCCMQSRNYGLRSHIIVTTLTALTSVLESNRLDTRSIKMLILHRLDILGTTAKFSNLLYDLFEIHLKHRRFQLQIYSSDTEDSLILGDSIRSDLKIMKLFDQDECFKSTLQFYVYCRNESFKYKALINVLNTLKPTDSVLIYCVGNDVAEMIWNNLLISGFKTDCLIRTMSQGQREQVLERFRSGIRRILVLCYPLGVSIEYVDCLNYIINYDLCISNQSFGTEYFNRSSPLFTETYTGDERPKFIINLVENRAIHLIDQIATKFNTRIIQLNALNENLTFSSKK